MKTKTNKAQLFSIDFLIAATLIVVIIGATLNFYEITSNSAKESNTRTELTIIGLTATQVLLKKHECELENNFKNQGYEVYGCSKLEESTKIKKDELMIPSEVKCRIEVDGVLLNEGEADNKCTDDPTSAFDVVSIERKFVQKTSEYTKQEYQNCVEGKSCNETIKTLNLKIWRE